MVVLIGDKYKSGISDCIQQSLSSTRVTPEQAFLWKIIKVVVEQEGSLSLVRKSILHVDFRCKIKMISSWVVKIRQSDTHWFGLCQSFRDFPEVFISCLFLLKIASNQDWRAIRRRIRDAIWINENDKSCFWVIRKNCGMQIRQESKRWELGISPRKDRQEFS